MTIIGLADDDYMQRTARAYPFYAWRADPSAGLWATHGNRPATRTVRYLWGLVVRQRRTAIRLQSASTMPNGHVPARMAGVVPSGVSQVTRTLASGAVVKIAVSDNAWAYETNTATASAARRHP